jgi:adenylate kinase
VLKFQIRDEDELLTRLKRRARADDTDDEVIRHRFNVYREQSEPLMRDYRKEFIAIDEWVPSMESSHRVLRALRR